MPISLPARTRYLTRSGLIPSCFAACATLIVCIILSSCSLEAPGCHVTFVVWHNSGAHLKLVSVHAYQLVKRSHNSTGVWRRQVAVAIACRLEEFAQSSP